jgi:hypothetical protein
LISLSTIFCLKPDFFKAGWNGAGFQLNLGQNFSRQNSQSTAGATTGAIAEADELNKTSSFLGIF